MYNNILFDLDGTLTDPGVGITNSVMYALGKFGIEVRERAELYKFIGPPLKDSFMEYYGFSEEKALMAVDYYREYFRDIGIFENRVYEGVETLLSTIKSDGKKIILATSKPEEFAVRILKHFGLYEYFHLVCGATFDGSRGEKADVIGYALDTAGITDMSDTVMIGDREYDILGAKTFGMDSVGVTYGYGSRKELQSAGATYIADNTSDILKYL